MSVRRGAVFSRLICTIALVLALPVSHAGASGPTAEALSPGTGPRHAIAMHGEPAVGPDAPHLGFVKPDAPKGGDLRLGEVGTFDSLNPYIIKGTVPILVRHLATASLMTRSPDEPFTLYGYIAKTIEVPEDRSWVEFTLNPAARFSDGRPVRVDDVIFSMETLRDTPEAFPNTRSLYAKIARVERPGEGRVRFVFHPAAVDRELPLIIGLMPVFSRAYYETTPFSETSLEPPVTAAPYRVAEVDPGRSLVFEKVPDYWAADLPAFRGRYNFDRVRLDYYRDANSAFEAFKAGGYDIFRESDLARWQTGYNFPALRDGRIKRAALPHNRASGMSAIAINTRRAPFEEIAVRRALVQLFDFDWMNENYFRNAFVRTQSFFDNSDLAGDGPSSEAERALLAPFADELDPAILEAGWQPPAGGMDARRANLLTARDLLANAGFTISDGRMIQTETGRALTFEIIYNNSDHERVVLAYADTLARLGIEARPRRVDTSQYQQRWTNFDFDLIVWEWWTGSLSPGNEQIMRWSSPKAAEPGSINLPGVASPGVDQVLQQLVRAETREDLRAATGALDRLLMSGYYVIPLYHSPTDHLAWSAELAFPDRPPLTGFGAGSTFFDTWWRAE